MSAEHNDFRVHKDVEMIRYDGESKLFAHAHGDEGMSGDEVRYRAAEQLDMDPSDIAVINYSTGEITRAPQRADGRKSRSYGFSKWGATWEPTGPQGNPSLN